MSELEKLLNKVVPIVMYRGCLVTKIKTGYKVLGVNCETVEEVDKVISDAADSIKKSLLPIQD